MHSFLLIGNGKDKFQEEIENLAKKLNARVFEFPVKKIAGVRELSKFTRIKISGKTAIVIKDIDEAGDEAQNAFLKSLEEPQDGLFYILTAKSEWSVLPTIISRCQIIEINNTLRGENSNFIKLSVGEKLEIVSKIKNREEAVEFITNLICEAHQLLLKNEINPSFIENANKTLQRIKANGNVALQLTNFVVNLDN